MIDQPPTDRLQLSLEGLAAARQTTDRLSTFLENRLRGFLDTLRPILLPPSLGRGGAGRTDKLLAEVREGYRRATERRLEMPRELDPAWLDELGTRLELNRWEYRHPLSPDRQGPSVQVTSPTRWLLSYGPALTLTAASAAYANRADKNLTPLRQHFVNALVLAAVVTQTSGLPALLGALRYRLEVSPWPPLNGLPLVTLAAELSSRLPSDEMIRTATAFSGVPAFLEVIDPAALDAAADPFWEELRRAASP